jgi:hypothetical protein
MKVTPKTIISWRFEFERERWPRRDSNPRPTVPKTDALIH